MLIIVCGIFHLYLTLSLDENQILTKNLKEIYNGSSNLLGPGYHDVPYVNISILPALDQQSGNCRSGYVCTSPISLDRILSATDGDRILIMGGPGAGKTRLTHRITELWTVGSVLSDCALYTFRLRWFQEEKVELRSVLRRYFIESPVLDHVVKESGSNNGKGMCFLLDGLDEYEVGYTDERNFFYRLMHRQKLSKAIVIVTTRNITSSGFEKMRWSGRYIIADFSDKQLAKFFEFTCNNLTHLVSQHRNLWMMCHIPLHASLLVKAFNTQKHKLDQISTRTKLFENIIIMILERDLEKSREPGKYEHIKDIEKLLEYPIVQNICSLAFNGSLSSPRRHSFADYEVPSELKWTNLSYFGIEPKPGASNLEVYSFTHPSLMDFLAALHLTRLNKSEQSRYITEYGNWYKYEDVWTFFCGLTHSFASHFIELYNKTTRDTPPQYHYLCIFEAQTHSNHGEVKSAAHHIMNMQQGALVTGPLHVTPYVLESLVFVMASGASHLTHLTLSVITFTNSNNGILSIFTGLVNSNATFPSLKVVNFLELHEEVKWDNKCKQYAKEFFTRTPKLTMATFSYVSASLAQLALYLPLSVNHLQIRHVHLQQSVVTPYLLLKSHPTLIFFHMDHCSITDRQLVKIGNLPSIVFDLSYNDIGDEGASEIARNIDSNDDGLRSIDLRFNNIGKKGLVALLNAAKVQAKPLFIDLRGNAVRNSDVDAIIAICNSIFPWNEYVLFIINLQENELTQAGHIRLRKEVVRSCLFVSSGNDIHINIDILHHIYLSLTLQMYKDFGIHSSSMAHMETTFEEHREHSIALQIIMENSTILGGR